MTDCGEIHTTLICTNCGLGWIGPSIAWTSAASPPYDLLFKAMRKMESKLADQLCKSKLRAVR
jgi:hypothetical protein